MKKCMICGGNLPEEAAFCPHCTASQGEKRPVAARRNGRTWPWIAGGIVLLTIQVILSVCVWRLWSTVQELAMEIRQTESTPAELETAPPASPVLPASPAPSEEPEPSENPEPSASPVLAESDWLNSFVGPVQTDAFGTMGSSTVPENITPFTITEVNTALDITGSLTPDRAEWQTAYLRFTPANTAVYVIGITAVPEADAVPQVGGIDICGNPEVQGTGMYADVGGMHEYIFVRCYRLTADQTYVFRVQVPAAGIDTAQGVMAKITEDWGFSGDNRYDFFIMPGGSAGGTLNIQIGDFITAAPSPQIDENYDHNVCFASWNPQQENDLWVTGLTAGMTTLDVHVTFLGETKTVTYNVVAG